MPTLLRKFGGKRGKNLALSLSSGRKCGDTGPPDTEIKVCERELGMPATKIGVELDRLPEPLMC